MVCVWKSEDKFWKLVLSLTSLEQSPLSLLLGCALLASEPESSQQFSHLHLTPHCRSAGAPDVYHRIWHLVPVPRITAMQCLDQHSHGPSLGHVHTALPLSARFSVVPSAGCPAGSLLRESSPSTSILSIFYYPFSLPPHYRLFLTWLSSKYRLIDALHWTFQFSLYLVLWIEENVQCTCFSTHIYSFR